MQTLNFQPRGFMTCSKNIGIKDESLDLTVIYSTEPASAAAMFTKNHFCGAPIVVGKENSANGRLQAFVINSKNANTATGEEGISNVRKIIDWVGNELGIAPEDILPASTGIIGRQLPMDKFYRGVQGLKNEMKEGGLEFSAQAIMTTDTHPKMRACKVGNAVIVGIAKGSGMIEPNMATMLSFFMTDALIPTAVLQKILREAVNLSFNMVSVDTDTSTSDMVAIMANGLAGKVDLEEFGQALKKMAIELAKEIAKDGEGATKLLEVTVEDAFDFNQAKQVAKSIVNSPLVKTAIFGNDPNWGRVAMAIGKCDEKFNIVPAEISIYFGDLAVFEQGKPTENNLDELKNYLKNNEVIIRVSLGNGNMKATVWGCDLTHDYVKINGEYTT
jgi:glutamate N-acetyltransferase/amino-acid N-acetyltransferase